ncbi:MAG: MerR family transcriptional regulator [Butyricicoccus pullicaecorum]|nr:MerR family transcriptional regulator [Butyricicoccus pullicaecorum]
MEYTIQELSKLAGISARTLRYYDEIGLLHPSHTTNSGYRIYTTAQIDTLQQILFYRTLGFPLKQIQSMMQAPDFDRLTALEQQRQTLIKEQERLSRLVTTINRTIQYTKGEIMMKDHEKFQAFKKDIVAQNEAIYGAELRTRYGDEQVDTANERILRMTTEEYHNFETLKDSILDLLEQAVKTGANPADEIGKQIYDLHCRWLSYTLSNATPEQRKGIASLYVADPRFTAYYDQKVSGCAKFLCEAVSHWA